MNYRSLALAILLIGIFIAVAGCEKTAEQATTTISTATATTLYTTTGGGTGTTGTTPTTSTTPTGTTVTTTATTAVTTTATTTGGSAPGSRTAVPPATLGGCTPPDPFMGYHTIALSGSNYANNPSLTSYTITTVWRDYSAAPFTPSIKLWVMDTVYDIGVLKQQMGSKGGYWGQTVDDVSHYAAYFTSQGFDGWEYHNKGTDEVWVGIFMPNGIGLYAHSTPAYSQSHDISTLEAFIDGLDLSCWEALAPV